MWNLLSHTFPYSYWNWGFLGDSRSIFRTLFRISVWTLCKIFCSGKYGTQNLCISTSLIQHLYKGLYVLFVIFQVSGKVFYISSASRCFEDTGSSIKNVFNSCLRATWYDIEIIIWLFNRRPPNISLACFLLIFLFPEHFGCHYSVFS